MFCQYISATMPKLFLKFYHYTEVSNIKLEIYVITIIYCHWLRSKVCMWLPIVCSSTGRNTSPFQGLRRHAQLMINVFTDVPQLAKQVSCIQPGILYTCVHPYILYTCVHPGILYTCVHSGILYTCIHWNAVLRCKRKAEV